MCYLYCKTAIISPLIKKEQRLDSEVLNNYRHVANLSFIKSNIEKAIATQIHTVVIFKLMILLIIFSRLIKQVAVVKLLY